MTKSVINLSQRADRLLCATALLQRICGGHAPSTQHTPTKIGAEPYERTAERATYGNGYRDRRWDARLGTFTLNVPNLREGGYAPSFIEHRRRSEQALISVINEAVV